MSDALLYGLLAAGFAVIVVGGSKLGAGTHQSLGGLFAADARPGWPRGVQEIDAPRFDLEHARTLRADSLVALTAPLDPDPDHPRPEVLEVDARGSPAAGRSVTTLVAVRPRV